MISRRNLVALAALFTAQAVVAQPKGYGRRRDAVRRVGFLSSATEQANVGYLEHFRAGMAELHWRDGQNYDIASRYANGDTAKLPTLVQELLALRPDVILAPGFLPTQALATATKTVPIVFMALIDPVGAGLVANLNKPSGNLTGFTDVSQDLSGKRVQLLKEAMPKLVTLAVIYAPGVPTNPPLADTAEKAATSLGLRTIRIEVRDTPDVDTAVRRAVAGGAQAFIVFASGYTQARRDALVKDSLGLRLPGIYYDGDFVVNGGFMSYATSPEIYRRVAGVVDKILKGANAGDIAVEQPTSFELFINLRTAAAIGVTVPSALQVRADRLIP